MPARGLPRPCLHSRMRVLFASTQGAGHFNPLVPFIEAALRQGHEVLVAGPSALAPAVAQTGYQFWEGAGPLEEEIRPVWDRVPKMSYEEANVLVVREIFARFDARAMLPRLRQAFEEWQPDLVLREPNEYSSAVAADLYGVPQARVGINLAPVEEGALDNRRGDGGRAPPGCRAARRSRGRTDQAVAVPDRVPNLAGGTG